jgi:hypothetical protein
MPLHEAFLIAAIAAVGVLHTLVPDHWLPIALLAREHGWSRRQTARTAFGAGMGHVLSTLLIGLVVWFAGVAAAARFGHLVDVASGVALVGFGLWTAISALLEQRHGHTNEPPESAPFRHRHQHAHEDGTRHTHTHAHDPASAHDAGSIDAAAPPLHRHEHPVRGRFALMLVLGSSPMVEGIPAFFAAARFGFGLVAIMSGVFAAATIATYVILCTLAAQRFQDVSVGPLEVYGEVLSGALVAVVGLVFLVWPVL